MTNKSIGLGCSMPLTCLKWSSTGELTAFDLHLVLGRLARVDQYVAEFWGDNLDLKPFPSTSSNTIVRR